jgi:hypothetical protein
MYKILLPLIVIALLAVVWFGGGSKYFNSIISTPSPAPIQTPVASVSPVETATPTPVSTVGEVSQKKVVPAGWNSYSNTDYNFSISFPSDYKVLTSKEDLYGWPKAVVLLYAGGQAYDVVIEVWNTEAEYKTAHPGENLAVYQVNGKFVTVLDQTKNAETESIVNSFSLTK